MTAVDVVVVAYNSGRSLRQCVEPLTGDSSVSVWVVDNASPQGGIESISDLPVTVLELESNRGFAFGCNRGWEPGFAPAVLFLNPDARIDPRSVHVLADALVRHDAAGAVAPRLVDEAGHLEFSQRRFPRARSTFAQALFLHRLFPRAAWSSETVADPVEYEQPQRAEWVSGACLMIRREALERLGGWDDGFFLYSEDKDICKRLWGLGYEVLFEPAAEAVHIGGVSAPRPQLLPVLAVSRIRYASKHKGRPGALAERAGVALGSLTHMLLTTKGAATRRGYLRSLRASLSVAPPRRPPIG